MKKKPIVAALFFSCISMAFGTQQVRIVGSDILWNQIKAPMQSLLKNEGHSTSINMKGSFTAIEELKNDKADIAIVAIPRAEKKPDGVVLFPIAYHAAYIAVNVANPIEEIATTQLYNIYSKLAAPRLDTWQALNVGNSSLKNIMAITTSLSDSLIVELFKYSALKSTGLGAWVNIAKSSSEALSILRANNSAIAVLGKVEDTSMIKILAISADEENGTNKYAFRPDKDNIFNGDYPLTLAFYIAVEKSKIAKFRPLLKTLLDDSVASIIDATNFISAPKNSRKKSIFELDISK